MRLDAHVDGGCRQVAALQEDLTVGNEIGRRRTAARRGETTENDHLAFEVGLIEPRLSACFCRHLHPRCGIFVAGTPETRPAPVGSAFSNVSGNTGRSHPAGGAMATFERRRRIIRCPRLRKYSPTAPPGWRGRRFTAVATTTRCDRVLTTHHLSNRRCLLTDGNVDAFHGLLADDGNDRDEVALTPHGIIESMALMPPQPASKPSTR